MLTTLAPADADLALWPASTRLLDDGDLAVGGVPLAECAERFGTPLYLVDEAEVRARCRAYRRAFTGTGPAAGAAPGTPPSARTGADAEVLYAAKAFLCRAMAHWVREEGLGLDVCSREELELAVATGFPAERIVLHGNAKSPAELEAALRLGVGRIVIDSPAEIARIAALVRPGERQKVLLRVVPGLAAGAHMALRTGVEGQKFGLSSTDGTAQLAVARVLGQPRLELAGLHCHLGSQIGTVKPYLRAVRRMVGLLAWVRRHHGAVLPELDLGGGHAVAYRPGEEVFDPVTLAIRVQAELAAACAAVGLPVPRLTVEPGRAVAAPAGVAVYRVLAVKRGGGRVFAAVDGGMSDNPRPALYGAVYTPRLVGRAGSAARQRVDVVGRHCEAGDVLAPDALLPADLRAGDLLGFPVAGAYQLSMSSGYNLVGRPPLAAVADGTARLLLRRETLDDYRARDVGL